MNPESHERVSIAKDNGQMNILICMISECLIRLYQKESADYNALVGNGPKVKVGNANLSILYEWEPSSMLQELTSGLDFAHFYTR